MARCLIDSATRPPVNLDAGVRETMAFQLLIRRPGGAERALREFPLLVAAMEAEEQDETAEKLRLLTLAGLDHSTIARRLGIDPEGAHVGKKCITTSARPCRPRTGSRRG